MGCQTWPARSWPRRGQGEFCYLRNLRWLHQGPGTAEEPHAMDSQGENPPEDDLQSATVELPEVPVPVFHGPRFGATLVGQPRAGHCKHAGRRQQGPRQWEVSRLWKGVPVEAAEPRGQRPWEDIEAGAPLLQVHSLHRHVWPVQAL